MIRSGFLAASAAAFAVAGMAEAAAPVNAAAMIDALAAPLKRPRA